MYWSLVKRDGLYYWVGESCWGGAPEELGGYGTREAALERMPLDADDWIDYT